MIQNIIGGSALDSYMLNAYPTPECPLKLFGPDYSIINHGLTITKIGNFFHTTGYRTSGSYYNIALMNMGKGLGTGSDIINPTINDFPIAELTAGDTYRVMVHIVKCELEDNESGHNLIRFYKCDNDFTNMVLAVPSIDIDVADTKVTFIAEEGKRYGFTLYSRSPINHTKSFTLSLERVSAL